MSAERMKVLEMLAAGKITAEDADRLLDKLGGSAPDQAAPKEKTEEGSASTTKKPRFLRIIVERPGQDNVNLRVPLSLTRTGRLLAILPFRIGERLAEHGIDLSSFAAMKDEELAKAVEDTSIDIDRGNGKKVRIFCE